MLNELKIVLAVTLVLILVDILLLGLPGAIVFESLAAPLIKLCFGADALEKLPPDSAWPIAIYLSILCPISIVPGYWIAFKLFSYLSRPGQIAILISFMLIWSLILSVGFYLISRRHT